MENLFYYEQLRAVPQEAQKAFDNGRFSGTDINPMWRIKRMTEVFGPCGIGWYYEVVHRTFEKSTDEKTISAFIGINLYVKVDGEWSKPIYGEGGNNFTSYNKKWQSIDTSDEAMKMALTDALSNATKQLGLGADVWFGNDKTHSTKYDAQQERNEQQGNAVVKNQPDSIQVKIEADTAREYLNNNQAAFEYYQSKYYSHRATLEEFTDVELQQIYGNLKRLKKI